MTPCPWCGTPFPPKKSGNQVKQFCSDTCKNAFWAGARIWVRDAIKTGLLTVANIKAAVAVHGARDGKDEAA